MAHTQSPVGEMFQELHVSGDGEDVHEVEEDVHHGDGSQMDQTLQADVPHLPFFSGQVRFISLRRAAKTCYMGSPSIPLDLFPFFITLQENT